MYAYAKLHTDALESIDRNDQKFNFYVGAGRIVVSYLYTIFIIHKLYNTQHNIPNRIKPRKRLREIALMAGGVQIHTTCRHLPNRKGN